MTASPAVHPAKKSGQPLITLRVLGGLQLLRVADGKSERLPIQPKRAALLAYLALHCADGPCARETLLPVFWPEVTEARARGALRKAIHELRAVVGEDVIQSTGSDQLTMCFDRLDCDASQFVQHLANGAVLAAVSIYTGNFFDGYAPPEGTLERWVSKQRGLFRARAYGATVLLATEEKRKGAWEPALFWARRAEDLAEDPEEAARLVMSILERSGNRAAALSRYASLTAELSEEFEIGPSPETQALAAKVRTPIRPLPSVTDERIDGSDFFKNIVEGAFDVIYCTDAKGFFTYGNPAGARVLGCSREQLIGRLYLDFVRPEYRNAMLEFYLRQIQQNIPITYYEFPVLRKDGKVVWLGQNVQLMEENGRPVGLRAIARDVTAKKVAEQLEESGRVARGRAS
ncbi:MAG: PAS domain S-box protein [Gemmatimonadaceae bacterium]|nr:PAS domain S-box protein [Gemmatimonadaceae bacterium]